MEVNYEIKGMLAKLLASEDIIVEHKNVSTACFNVHTRILTLPIWRASNNVVDLLIAHECGHSIFTDDIDWTETCKVPQSFVNIVEDARVEKLMKRKYAGLSKTFYNGYKELNEQDFFKISSEDISKFNLADRANLYFKIGNFIDLDFNSEEQEIINLIGTTETFSDVLYASEQLYKYCKQEKYKEEKIADLVSDEIFGNSQSSSNQTVDVNESLFDEEGDSDKDKMQESENSGGTTGGQETKVNSGGDDNEPEVHTANSLEENIRELVDKSGCENTYIEVPEVNLNTIIVKNADIHKDIDSYFSYQQKQIYDNIVSYPYDNKDLYSQVDREFKKFKSSSQKEVNYLVKEFECRKAADQYSRASIARTGILDTSRIHSYKYNEDLFKKISVIPDGKNHGLVFVLDWSGSMSGVMLDTCKQLFNLVWFCKKVSIPFDVYAFTNEWRRGGFDHENNVPYLADRTPHYKKKRNLIVVDENFSMMNILTSKVSNKEIEHQLNNIWRLACCFSSSFPIYYNYPTRLALSGTPLNESIISLHQILPKFKKENKLQKVHCIILTDGEANQAIYHKEITRPHLKEPYLASGYVYPLMTYLRDRKIGTTYRIESGQQSFTDTLLHNLKDKFPSISFVGIRVLENRNFQSFIKLYYDYNNNEYSKIQKDWTKLKSFTITNSGYHAYFGISSSSLSQDTSFELPKNATKSQIKSAFSKSLKIKKLNKRVLGEFISLVV